MDNSKDIEAVLDRRNDNGGDFWAIDDGRLAVGSPFSTLESLQTLMGWKQVEREVGQA